MQPHFIRKLAARALFIPTLGWNYLLGRVLHLRNWSDRVDEHVILGALPFRRDVSGLVEQGVKAVVNTCEEYPGPLAAYTAAGIEQFHMPTCDFCHPELDDVERAVAFMERHIDQGNTVYIHCKAGRARSATVVLCWLVKSKGMTPQDAQQFLLTKRAHVNPRLTRRPVVIQFCRKYARPSD